MALWNEIADGKLLEQCIICYCQYMKKRRVKHLHKCIEQHGAEIDDMVNCPLNPMHIIPLKYLDHHLEGNCSSASSLLKNFFQDRMYQDSATAAPDDFLRSVPSGVLSHNNKTLLYLLRPTLTSEDIEPGNVGDFMNDCPS